MISALTEHVITLTIGCNVYDLSSVRVFAENLVGLGLLYTSLFPVENQSQPMKKYLPTWGKKWPKSHF